MKNLEHENQLLRSLIKDFTTLIKELFAVMPEEVREQENSKKLIELMHKIDIYLEQVEDPPGPALSASDYRQ